MCTYVETPDVRILLDAGVSLCPNRFGLLPHPAEFRAIIECRKEIARAAEEVDAITVSHYHYDHHTPSFEDWLVNWTEDSETARQIYEGKTIWAKNPRENINPSQRERAWLFAKTGGKHSKEIVNADGKTITFGKTRIRFSGPMPHGPDNSELGWVLMTAVQHHDEKFLFAPDVQGPMSNSPLQFIVKENPQLLMIGGPPLYLSPLKVAAHQIETSINNLTETVRIVPHVVLDHHILREESWQEKILKVLYETYKQGSVLQTAAEFLGRENNFLEARRKRLFELDPPSKKFGKWMKAAEEVKKRTKPPI